MPALLSVPRFESYDTLLYRSNISVQDLLDILSKNEKALTSYLTSINNQFQDSVESVNAVSTIISNLALTAQDIGFTISGGINPRTLTVDLSLVASTGLFVNGTSNRIRATGSTTLGVGGQVSSIDIDPVYPGQESITTLGNISTGTWNAGQITAPLLRILNNLGIVAISVDSTGINFGKDGNNRDILLFINKAVRRGSIFYSVQDNITTTLDPNITATRKFLSQVGDGSISNDPEWVEVTSGIGPQGIPGIQGMPGVDGEDAEIAYIFPGVPGNQGPQGIPGIMGIAGLDGEDGAESFVPGIPGVQGVQGIQGLIGPPGLDGIDPDEPLYIPGPQGIPGTSGVSIQGPPGIDADDPEMPYIIPGPPGPGHVGNVIVDFGSFPGTCLTEMDVTGQVGFINTSKLQAYVLPISTSDHSADEHSIESILVSAVYKVDGTFTVRAFTNIHPAWKPINGPFGSDIKTQVQSIYGQFTIGWFWA